MHKTSRAPTVRSPRRFLAWGPIVAASAALLSAGGCQGEEDGDSTSTLPAFSGAAPTASAGAGGAPQSTGGSSAVSTGGTSSGDRGPATNINNNSAASGGTGGALGVGGSTSEVPKPCVDVQPPPDPTWPGATCENWATETTECSAGWFAQYCDVSCGRCIPEGGSALPQPVDCSGEGLPNVTGGEGYTTRYWDCCQTHCAQFDGHKCSQDGTSRTGDSTSACQGGGSFACYDEAPREVSKCLSYGYIAKANPNCGGCYRIQFTGEGEYNPNDPGSRLIKGKQMIVKVSNTGSDVNGNQFDLMIPGGGVGMFNACSRQWNQNALGATFGGFLTECTGGHSAKKECVRQQCAKIPAGDARDGCLWFVDWLEVADDPKFTSQPTDCPF
jgi:glycosyl hydrolase family 45